MARWLLASVFFSSIFAEPVRHRVVIVGAGVSGFTAAATLLEHNVTDFVVLEATDRIGGRINTVQFGGVTIDKGAEFCHGEVDNAVYELIGSHDLLTSYMPVVRPDKFLYANSSGDSFNTRYVNQILTQVREIFYEDELQHFNGSVADYFFPRLDTLLASKNVDPYLREAIRHLAPRLEGVYTAADDLSNLGCWGHSQSVECEGDNSLKWKNGTGGYKTIFDFISKKLPAPSRELPVVDKIVLGKQVTKVERREGEVEVTCADGSTYVTNHVIVTVSLGVLKKHAAAMFRPPLPTNKTAAIQALGFGCVGKVFLLFPSKWWPNNVSSIFPLFSVQDLENFKTKTVHGSWTSYTTGFYPVVNHDRMLCAWFHGPHCRIAESLTEKEVIDGLMELLNKIVGKKYQIPQPEGVLRTNWASYPYTLGAYSYGTVASDRQNLSNSDLAEPVLDSNNTPVLLFAGEATHPQYSSTVHGALATGRREAHNLITYFKELLQ